jgi:hypothetical protein
MTMGKKVRKRSNRGQSLIEGTVFLVIFIGLFITLVLGLVNLSIVVSEQQKIQVAATQAAQYIIGQRYWLGAVRTDYDQSKSQANARAVADGVLKSLGLPASCSFTTTDLPLQNGIIVSTVTVSVAGLPLLNGAAMPIPMSACSASTTAQDITQGWRCVSIQCADPNNPQDQAQWRTAMVPCYNYLVGPATTQSSPIQYSSINGPTTMGSVTVIRSDTAPATITNSGPGGTTTAW